MGVPPANRSCCSRHPPEADLNRKSISFASALRSRRGDRSTCRLVNEELARSLHYLVELRFVDLSNGVKNDVMFDAEKPLRANVARLIDLAALTIATIQRDRKTIEVRAAGDLAENQISTR
jgi:hypothetical protein